MTRIIRTLYFILTLPLTMLISAAGYYTVRR